MSMNNKQKNILYCIFMFVFFVGKANDSTNILTQEKYINWILDNHPLVKQADLIVKDAKAKLLQAKGAFDPELGFAYDNKTLDGSQYYQYIQPQIKVPLWYGIEIKAETNSVRGNNTANELTYGNSVSTGISLPLLSGLVTNKKMTTLKQAKNNIQLSQAEQQIVINNLLLDAIEEYWNWSFAYQNYNNYNQAQQISLERFNFTKRLFEVGERPVIDTIEAFSQLKLLEYETQNAYYNWIKANLQLSLYLWNEKEEAVFIRENTIPSLLTTTFILDTLELPKLSEVEQLVFNHPKINAYDLKLKNLEVERKLKFQSLLPNLNVNYNFINKTYNPFNNIGDNLFLNNYKIGVNFSMPLLFRAARGEYQQAKIKIESTRLDKTFVQNELSVKAKTYFNDLLALKEKLKLYNETFLAYQALLQGETTRFQNGESTLFLLNTRQNKVLEALLNLNSLQTKYMQYNTNIYLIAGQNFK